MLHIKFKTISVDGDPRTARVIFTDHPEACRGHYLIQINDPCVPDEDVPIAAELFAIQKAFSLGIEFAISPKTGRSLQLQVSFGAIRKLKNADSEKTHLVDYAHALATKYSQAVVTVETGVQAWMAITPPKAKEFIVDRPSPDYVYCPALHAGVKVTRHALQRLYERIENYRNSKDIYRTVSNSLAFQNNKLEVIKPSDHAISKARKRYGYEPTFVFDHVNSAYLIMAKHGHRYDLVTAIANTEYSDFSILGH